MSEQDFKCNSDGGTISSVWAIPEREYNKVKPKKGERVSFTDDSGAQYSGVVWDFCGAGVWVKCDDGKRRIASEVSIIISKWTNKQ
jgi:hypothetical protein